MSKNTIMRDIGRFLFFALLLFLIIFLLNNKDISFLQKTSENRLVKNFSVTQLPSVPGETIKWVKTTELKQINTSEHIVSLPGSASNIKISTSSPDILEQAPKLTSVDRQKLSTLASERSKTKESLTLARNVKNSRSKGFVASVSRLFSTFGSMFATVGEAIDPNASSTPEVILVDLMASSSPIVEEIQPTQEEETLSEEASTSTEVIDSIASTSEDISTSTEVMPEETSTSTEVQIAASSTDIVSVEYETPAPVIAEAETETGKIVQVSAVDPVTDPSATTTEQITNVLAFTNIPEIYKVGQESKIKIKWTNNNDQNVTFHAYDLNENGKLDYIEWTVPHLSTQTFEIIFISKAFQLDSELNILEDVYDQLVTQDDTWISVEDGQYVRVTFEKILNNSKDITIFARPSSSTSEVINSIEVYPVYTDSDGVQTQGEKIELVSDGMNPTFENISKEGKYRILLKNLPKAKSSALPPITYEDGKPPVFNFEFESPDGGPTAVFDLKIKGNIDLDFVVDPDMAGCAPDNYDCTSACSPIFWGIQPDYNWTPNDYGGPRSCTGSNGYTQIYPTVYNNQACTDWYSSAVPNNAPGSCATLYNGYSSIEVDCPSYDRNAGPVSDMSCTCRSEATGWSSWPCSMAGQDAGWYFDFSQPYFATGSGGGGGGPVAADPVGLVAHYKMNDTNGTSAVDSAWGNNGTGTYTSASGKINGAASFNGSSDYVSATIAQPSVYSLAYWVKIDSLPSSVYFASALDNYSMDTQIGSDGKIIFQVSADNYVTSVNPLTAGVWAHVVAIYDGANAKIYLNGSLEVSAAKSLSTGNTNFLLGKRSDGYFLDGSLDDVRIYDKALTKDEVYSLYNAGSGTEKNVDLGDGIIGHFKMNDNVESTAVVDSSVSANTAVSTRNSSLMSASGKVNDALTLNGSDYINVTSNPKFTDGDFTISGWFNPATLADKTIWSRYASWANTKGDFIIYLQPSGRPLFNIYGPSGWVWTAWSDDLKTTNSVSTNTWSHVSVSKKGTEYRIYLNGNLEETKTSSENTADTSNSNPFLIGSNYDAGSGQYINRFAGSLDDFRIYDRALNNSEILAIYNGSDGTEDNDSKYTDGDYTVEVFKADGIFTPPAGVTEVEALVVAGGGGGSGGGGGAGGLIYDNSYSVSGNISVTVGAGGTGATNSAGFVGANGGNTTFDGLVAVGGGGGRQADTNPGIDGGSGGGGGQASTLISLGGLGTTGQGNNGGGNGGYQASPYPAGGGGGAGSVGGNATDSTTSGNGGAGLSYSISGISTYYAGGGGGESFDLSVNHGLGGLGGGGDGGVSGVDGVVNSGGGGGGSEYQNPGGDGGSGIVIIRYLTPAPNESPVASFLNDFSTWNSGDITVNYILTDVESNALNISQTANSGIEYSLDNSTWYDATEKVGGSSQGLTNLTSSPVGVNHVFVWDSATDLATTEDSTVYIRIRPNDGASNGNWVTSSAFGIDNSAPSANLVAHFKMNDNTASTVVLDSSSYAQNASMVSQNTENRDIVGVINGGLSFVTTEYARTTGQAALTALSSPYYSMSFWLKRTVSNVHFEIFNVDGHPFNTCYYNKDINKMLWYSDGIGVEISTVMTAGTWYNFTFVRNGAIHNMYKNGVLVGTNNASVQYTATALKIGGAGTNYNNTRNVDDVRIYNKALSQAEIDAIYNSGSGTETGVQTYPTLSLVSTSSITVNKTTAVGDNGSGLSSWMVRRNGITESDWIATTTTTYSSESLSANTQFYYDVRFKDTAGNISTYGATSTVYTLANTPSAPTLGNILPTTIGLNPVSGGAESSMAIYAEQGATCDGSAGLGYIQANGSISASAVWQSDVTWATTTVTGLSENTQYSFCAKARNGDSVETTFGSSVSGTTTISNIAPNIPTLVSPANSSYTSDNTPTLSATYSDPDTGDIGTTNYRISSSVAPACVNNTNIVTSGTSVETGSNSQATTWTPLSSIGSDATYYWCAQNNDGATTSAWTSMGSFTLDTTAPVVSVTAPSNNTVVYGNSVSISADATDAVSVSGVQFKLDSNTNIGSEDITSPYSIVWDTTEVPNGTHTIIAVAQDDLGNTSTSTAITVTVDNSTPVISNVYPTVGSNVVNYQTVSFSLDEIGSCRMSLYAESFDEMSDNIECSVSNGILISCRAPNLGTAGTKNLYLACEDSYGNKDTAQSATHLSYYLPPQGRRVSQDNVSSGGSTSVPTFNGPFEISINNGETVTSKGQVTLNLISATNTSAVILTTSPDFSSTETIPYQSVYNFDICSGKTECIDGEYNIYAKFLSNTGESSNVTSAKIKLNAKPIITDIVENTKDIIGVITDVLLPKTDTGISYPSIDKSVPEVAQETFQNKWEIVTPASLDNFVFEKFPKDLQTFVSKFPEVSTTLQKIGITRMSDISQLSGLGKISLPGLSTVVGLPKGQGLVLADFSSKQAGKIPTDIIFARTASEDIDLSTKLSISNEGLALQTLNISQGQPLKFVIKPEGKAKRVQGYMLFKSSDKNVSNINSLSGEMASALLALEQINSDVDQEATQIDFVLNKFDYIDQGNGIWTADVSSPLSLGQYELKTVVEYKDKKANKTVSMIVLVDPEGYVYKVVDGEETRIKNAKVSIYWQNPETNTYELWPAKDFRQENPQTTDVTGRYAFLVPEGDYYLKVEAENYKDYIGDVFKVEESKGVFINIELKEKGLSKILNLQTILLIGIFIVLIYLVIIFTVRRGKKGKLLYN